MKKRAVFIGASFILFSMVTVLVLTGAFEPVESAVYQGVAEAIHPFTTTVMIIISDFVSAPVISGFVIVLMVLPKTRYNFGIPIALAVLVAVTANQLLKLIFSRERPAILPLVSEQSFSYPSAHAMVGMAVYFTIILLAWRHIGNTRLKNSLTAFLSGLILLIGISRVYLGVHYFGDVLAGWLLGFCIALSLDTCRVYLDSKKQKNQDVLN